MPGFFWRGESVAVATGLPNLGAHVTWSGPDLGSFPVHIHHHHHHYHSPHLPVTCSCCLVPPGVLQHLVPLSWYLVIGAFAISHLTLLPGLDLIPVHSSCSWWLLQWCKLLFWPQLPAGLLAMVFATNLALVGLWADSLQWCLPSSHPKCQGFL